MTHKSQIIWVQSYGYKSNYFHLKLNFLLSLCPYFGTRRRWRGGCILFPVDRGQCGRTAAALLSALRCTRTRARTNPPPSLWSTKRKILYNKTSSSHLGISRTEYSSEVFSVILIFF